MATSGFRFQRGVPTAPAGFVDAKLIETYRVVGGQGEVGNHEAMRPASRPMFGFKSTPTTRSSIRVSIQTLSRSLRRSQRRQHDATSSTKGRAPVGDRRHPPPAHNALVVDAATVFRE